MMTTHPSIEEFKSKGWYLSQEGIEFIASKNKDLKTIDDYVRHAKDVKNYRHVVLLTKIHTHSFSTHFIVRYYIFN
jgi:hypothetical protein